MAKHKIRRDALLMKSASVQEQMYIGGSITAACGLDLTKGLTVASTLAVTLGTTLASTLAVTEGVTAASTVAVTGGLTAASTFEVSGSAIIGSGGTAIAGILCGSGQATFGSLAASVASATSLDVTGLTQNHKIFIGASDISGCLNVASLSCSPGGGVLVFGVVNAASEQYTGATETFSYLAILDK